MKIKIVGGMSIANQVSIFSDEFIATAHSDKKGYITCKVTRHSSLLRFLYKNKRLPVPMLIRMMLFLADTIIKNGWRIINLYVLGVALGIILGIIVGKDYPLTVSQLSALLMQYWWVINVAIIAGVLAYVRQYIAIWHGAEHMAIAAYERTCSTDIRQIEQESPIHDHCGTRLFLPFNAGIFIFGFLAKNSGIFFPIVLLVFMECVLWIDTLYGWDKIPGISHASRLIQKYVTTHTPGMQEMLTAQRALEDLVAAHHHFYL